MGVQKITPNPYGRLRRATAQEIANEMAFREKEWKSLKDGKPITAISLALFETLYVKDGKIIPLQYVRD